MNMWIVFQNLTKSDGTEWDSVKAFRAAMAESDHDGRLFSGKDLGMFYGANGCEFFSTKDGRHETLALPDVVMARSGVDTSPSTFALYAELQNRGIPIINTPESIKLSGDKIATGQLLKSANLPCPDFLVAGPSIQTEEIVDKLGLPVVAKIAVSRCGNGVSLLKTKKEVEEYLVENKDNGILFQKYIARSHGRDFRIVVVGGEIIASIERRSTTEDFRANLTRGGIPRIIEPSAEMIDLAIRSTELFGLDVTGLDLLDGPDGPLICELNSAPAFPPGYEGTASLMVQHVASKAKGQNAFDAPALTVR